METPKENPELIYEDLTGRIIELAIAVHKALGPGLVERFYERALCIELELADIPFQCQPEYAVSYRGEVLGMHRLDLVVDKRVSVELKAVSDIAPVHMAQARSSIKAAGLRVALILNFAKPVLEIKRVVQ